MIKNTRFTITTLDHESKLAHSENAQKMPTIDIGQLIVNQRQRKLETVITLVFVCRLQVTETFNR